MYHDADDHDSCNPRMVIVLNMLMLIIMVALMDKMRRLTECIAMSVNVVSVNGNNQCSLLALV